MKHSGPFVSNKLDVHLIRVVIFVTTCAKFSKPFNSHHKKGVDTKVRKSITILTLIIC